MSPSTAAELTYQYSNPPLEARFEILGGHYNGEVTRGNLFLQTDIPNAPVIRWKGAKARKLYTLLMMDLDGNCLGSHPDEVPVGENAPLRHWVVGNIPGEVLTGAGYKESSSTDTQDKVKVLMPYRAPHIRVVSDRYGLYLFEQKDYIEFAELPETTRKNFDYKGFLTEYALGEVKAANHFVAIYVSESPFSGKPFQGLDVAGTWHTTLGKGKLPPSE